LRKGMITNQGRESHTYNKDYGNLSFYHLEGLILFLENTFKFMYL
jgi:hypothetical protein